MKKPTKIILLCLLAAVLIAAGVGAYVAAPFLAMRPVKTGLVFDGYDDTPIYAVRNGMGAVYFIETGDGTIMIDAGSNAKALRKSMKAAGIQTEDVKWILLTHSDYDHVDGLFWTGRDFYMSEDEMGHVDGTVPRTGVDGGNHLPQAPGAVHLLRDEQNLNLGGTTVTCIKAPGHTMGSMAYLIDGNLFSGDAVRLGKGLMVHPFTMDSALAERSIQKLQGYTWNTIFSSHYGYRDRADLIK